METHSRLEANAIIDRLIIDGPTFSADDARRLIELIPVARAPACHSSGASRAADQASKGTQPVSATLR